MSGWIKYEKDLETDPRFLRMLRKLCHAPVTQASRTDVTPALVPAQNVSILCGALVRFWSYADAHLRADDRLDLGPADVDALLGVPGFCAAMPEDWLVVVDDETVELPDYQRHNGVEARKRALDQKRQENRRRRDRTTERHAPVTLQRDASVTEPLLDQTRPDQTKTKRLRSTSSGDLSPSRSVGAGKDVLKKREENRKKVDALVAEIAEAKRWA